MWIGIEVDEGTLNLDRLSRAGWDLIGAEDLTADELLSVGVRRFVRLELPVDVEE